MGDGWEISRWPFRTGIFGFHLTIDPQRLPPETVVGRAFAQQALRLTDRELKALSAGRGEGLTAVRNAVDAVARGFSPDKRQELAEKITDALMDYSLSGQLSREAPTAADRISRQNDTIDAATRRGSLPTLIETVPVGATLTIHFGRPRSARSIQRGADARHPS